MSVITVPVTSQVPKEGKEILDAAFGLVKHFVNGGKLEGAAALLPSVMVAVDNFQQVSEELKSEYKDELAGYAVQKALDALVKAPVQA